MPNRDKKTLYLGWMICLLGAFFYCYEYLLRIEPVTMIAELEDYYHLSDTGLGFLTAFYYYAYTPMQLFVGAIIDYYGPRLILTIAVACCALGSFLFGSAEVVSIAAVGRFMIGFGSAFAFVGVLKLAATWLPVRFFALFTGLTTGLGMVGAMAGNMAMVQMIHNIGWQETIHYGTVLGLILVPIIWFVIRDHHSWTIGGESHRDFESLTSVIQGVKSIMLNRQMWMSGMIGMIMFFSLSIFAEAWGPRFLSLLYPGSSTDAITSANVMVFAGWLVGAPFAGWFSDAIQSRRLPLILGSLTTFFLSSFILFYSGISIELMRFLLFLFGFCSAVQINCFVLGRENCPDHMSATAVAFINMCVMLSGMVFQPLVGVVSDYSQRLRLGMTSVGSSLKELPDYQYALALIPIGLLIAFVLALCIEDTYGQGGIEE